MPFCDFLFPNFAQKIYIPFFRRLLYAKNSNKFVKTFRTCFHFKTLNYLTC